MTLLISHNEMSERKGRIDINTQSFYFGSVLLQLFTHLCSRCASVTADCDCDCVVRSFIFKPRSSKQVSIASTTDCCRACAAFSLTPQAVCVCPTHPPKHKHTLTHTPRGLPVWRKARLGGLKYQSRSVSQYALCSFRRLASCVSYDVCVYVCQCIVCGVQLAV